MTDQMPDPNFILRPTGGPDDSPPNLEEVTSEFLTQLVPVLMAMREVADTVFDSAKAMRERLVEEGWSDALAEQMAAAWAMQIVQGFGLTAARG